MSDDRVFATYWIETAFPLEQAAATMAGEQSTGTFVRVPGETDALREAHAARVEAIDDLGEVAAPSLPGSGLPKSGEATRRAARVVLSWPLVNLGASLPNLLATVAGNLSELKAFSGLKLIDLTLPPAFLDRYQGPQFGVAGTRRLAGVYDRPIIGTIIKPSVGLSPEATADQVRVLVEAGVDFIKDDELQADGPHCPFDARISAVMRVINDHADKTGKKVMYAANLTGDIDEMLARHDHVVAHGGTCIMASMNSIGLPAMKVLRAHSQLPIHGHRNGWGMLGRSPAIGMSFIAYQKLWRLAGIDHTHVNGIDNKFCEPNDSVIASARECLTPMFDAPHPGCEIMPVFSSGQSARQAAPTYAALGSVDCMFAAGGGIMAHPGGPAAGVRALMQAWEAAVAGVPVEQAAKDSPELAAALGAFGG
ncbi:ribulose-bisphosphate carboxylase large subunit family protein [Sphingomonas sp. H39-1-10]|uniref:ribulose-bisphosphate carboxylase large subunit family protein n=1 Tax=Sphingomonas pollutisoli TaxID=3030829 RepID=UPI0023B8F03C|nr:ribulose-bisphosphate carboxylase large subunit family protein [Sphingomonas pollutisoli]MDF0487364.1 ribulose-bisphosphate carboxylase large subunit family protein [Sphingomonas pollutisoli]